MKGTTGASTARSAAGVGPLGLPRTDGVDFRVYLPQLDEMGRPVGKLIWSRFLDPVHHPSDRGLQEADILLGFPTPQAVVLETDPGPKHILSFSYWAGVEFHQ